MEYDRLYDSSSEHDSGDRKALYRTRGRLVARAVQLCTLIRRDKREEEAQELGLKEREAVLQELKTSRNSERSSVRDKQSRPQGFTKIKVSSVRSHAQRCVKHTVSSWRAAASGQAW